MKTLDVVTWKNNCVRIIDQTKLPLQLVYVDLKTIPQVWDAIKKLKVRGAPAIGIAGALGVALAAYVSKAKNKSVLINQVQKANEYLATSRPTAVNLFWALDRMKQRLEQLQDQSIENIKKGLQKEAEDITQEDKQICRKLGDYGARLIKNNDIVLTHCNAGALATADYGTALGVFYSAHNKGKKFHVYVDETRPLLQGARLSAWELMHYKIDATLICDNMAASVINHKQVSKVIVGADRIASNGDTANKIGTYNLAVLCHFHKIPFYIAAPLSTFDFSLKNGTQIPIETRDPEEVTNPFGCRIAPKGIKVYNPAFDVTPRRLISGFITEYGVYTVSELLQLKKKIKLG